MGMNELHDKLNNWRSLTIEARDKCVNSIKYVEFTGQLQALDAVMALVKLFIEAEEINRVAEEPSSKKSRKTS